MSRFVLQNNPQAKLGEAEYFLGQMRAHQLEPLVFGYNLSAFLAAGRSVEDFLRSEYANHRPGFRLWWKKRKRPQIQADRELKLLNRNRNLTIHQRIVPLQGRWSAHVIESVGPATDVATSVVRVIGGSVTTSGRTSAARSPAPSHVATGSTTVRWYFAEVDDRDVIAVCESILHKLRDVVNECTTRWG
jgi:hypothetical protein